MYARVMCPFVTLNGAYTNLFLFFLLLLLYIQILWKTASSARAVRFFVTLPTRFSFEFRTNWNVQIFCWRLRDGVFLFFFRRISRTRIDFSRGVYWRAGNSYETLSKLKNVTLIKIHVRNWEIYFVSFFFFTRLSFFGPTVCSTLII